MAGMSSLGLDVRYEPGTSITLSPLPLTDLEHHLNIYNDRYCYALLRPIDIRFNDEKKPTTENITAEPGKGVVFLLFAPTITENGKTYRPVVSNEVYSELQHNENYNKRIDFRLSSAISDNLKNLAPTDITSGGTITLKVVPERSLWHDDLEVVNSSGNIPSCVSSLWRNKDSSYLWIEGKPYDLIVCGHINQNPIAGQSAPPINLNLLCAQPTLPERPDQDMSTSQTIAHAITRLSEAPGELFKRLYIAYNGR